MPQERPGEGPAESPGILVVDGEPRYREEIAEILATAGLECAAVESGAQALEAATDAAIGVVLLDVGLEDASGGSLLERLLALRPSLRVIAVSGASDEDRVLDALRGGACDYLAKPVHDEELVLAVRRAGESYAVASSWTQLRGRLDRLVARMEELAGRVAGRRGEDRLIVVREGVVEAASEVLEAEKTSLLLIDAEGIVLHVAACVGRSMKPAELDPVEVGGGVAGSVFEQRESWVVKDAAADPRVPGVDREGRYATASFAAVPVVAGDAPIGVLCATDRMVGGAFGDEDLGLLRILAIQAGELLALTLATTVEDELPEEDAALERTDAAAAPSSEDVEDALDRDAELAREIGQAAIDEVEADRVIRGVMMPLVKLLPAAPVSIFLLDPEDGELRKEGECDGGVAGDREQLVWGRGLTGHVLQTGQLIATARPDADPRFDREIDTPIGGAARPLLCVPLKLRGKVIGVCRAFLHEGDTVSARTGEVIGAVLSAAVRNALLYRSLVEAIEDVADARRAARG